MGCEIATAYDFTADGINYTITDFGNLTCKVDTGSYSGNIIIPEKVEYLGKKLKVTDIGTIFANKGTLYSIVLPKGIILKKGCFALCSNLQKIILPPDLEIIPDYSFENCISLKDINLPETVKQIGDYAFYNCANLSKIVFPRTLNYIYPYAFYGCKNISTIEIPQSVTTIGERSFSECKSLNKVSIANNSVQLSAGVFANDSNIVNVSIPSNMRLLPDSLFINCISLKSVEFPRMLKSIGKDAFSGCKNLENITFNEYLSAISDRAFKDCNKITSLTLPERLDSIGAFALYGTSIDSLYVPDAVAHITSTSLRINTLKKLSLGQGILKLPINVDITVDVEHRYYCSASISDLYRTIHIDSNEINYTYFDRSGISFYKWGNGYYEDSTMASLMNPSHNRSNITHLIIRDGDGSYNLNCGYMYASQSEENLLLNIKDMQYLYIGRNCLNNPWANGSIKNLTGKSFANEWRISNYKYDTLDLVPKIKILELGGNCNSLPQMLCYMDTLIVGPDVTKISFYDYTINNNLIFNQANNIKHIKLLGTVPPQLSGNFSKEQYINLNITIPKNCIETYQSDPEWKKFWNMKEGSYHATSLVPDNILSETAKYEVGRFNINGMPVGEKYLGIVIIRYSDGTSQKKLIK